LPLTFDAYARLPRARSIRHAAATPPEYGALFRAIIFAAFADIFHTLRFITR